MSPEATVLDQWIEYCRNHRMYEKGKGLLLLLDFAEGIMTDNFYRQHAAEALSTLNGLDPDKTDVPAVQEKLTPIVKRYMDEKEEAGDV